MLKRISTLSLCVLAFSFIYAQNQSMDSVSYSLGILMAQNLQRQGFENIDAASMAAGINDVISGNPLKVDPNQANNIVNDYLSAQQMKQHGTNKTAGEAFLAENAKRPGVTVLPSGLQYEIMKAGSGPKPAASNRVTVHYHGTLIDGTVFDSSVDRGQPATFGVTQVIQGWVEGLQLMPQGSKWKLFIPYQLAYGERAAGAKIQPFSALIFEVELLSIQ
jgi:FKBP-type peptidyl-prolyl cis-trans isomerase FklB